MVSQIAIPSRKVLGGFMPYAFTEHGVLMLANVLKSEQATIMSIRIIEIFFKMREMLITNKDLLLKINELESKVGSQDTSIKQLFKYLKLLIPATNEPRKQIDFVKEN